MESEPRRDPMNHAESDRSIAALFRQLSRDIATLFRKEAELARAEIRQKGAQVASAVSELAVGALLGFAGLLFLLQAAVSALAEALDSPALAALIVGLVVTAIGAGMLVRGRSHLKAENLAPTQTVDSLREDAELVRHGGRLPDENEDTSRDVQRSH
jgi:Putative Actinobacterial Holin-X, holin superfamily III